MGHSPDQSRIGIVAKIIADTFDVSEFDARESATALVALADEWGAGGAVQDWSHVVKKHFGGRFKWRSEATRQKFEGEGKATAVAYERYIRARK